MAPSTGNSVVKSVGVPHKPQGWWGDDPQEMKKCHLCWHWVMPPGTDPLVYFSYTFRHSKMCDLLVDKQSLGVGPRGRICDKPKNRFYWWRTQSIWALLRPDVLCSLRDNAQDGGEVQVDAGF